MCSCQIVVDATIFGRAFQIFAFDETFNACFDHHRIGQKSRLLTKGEKMRVRERERHDEESGGWNTSKPATIWCIHWRVRCATVFCATSWCARAPLRFDVCDLLRLWRAFVSARQVLLSVPPHRLHTYIHIIYRRQTIVENNTQSQKKTITNANFIQFRTEFAVQFVRVFAIRFAFDAHRTTNIHRWKTQLLSTTMSREKKEQRRTEQE